ncbi:winged helix-turn-helix transcriptional regulator [Isoptericola sp. NEAU-Y5]|uniref:Winged helix-turn-helix transcriptional regulator n=1 Tax=Isoptericola luteus TaxID=2879484 RepID=A0ABS7ZHX1_9MICO|nr:winged helix-turn-helix transcriptional regulator [Isoptericola sp. NEAU-Y5]MCA5894097.1 winged helix-turn-helix transcriptional regulator [Isoptericola sp. NEAU-Y5]
MDRHGEGVARRGARGVLREDHRAPGRDPRGLTATAPARYAWAVAPRRNGLVERTVHPVVPPRAEYTLTEPGRGLRATVDLMCEWTRHHIEHIESARRPFDA